MSIPSLGQDAWFGVLPVVLVTLNSEALPLPLNIFFHLASSQEYVSMEQRRRRSSAHAWDPALIDPLQLSITLSPYTSIASPLFLRSLRDNEASYWLSLQPRFGGCLVWDMAPHLHINPVCEIKAE